MTPLEQTRERLSKAEQELAEAQQQAREAESNFVAAQRRGALPSELTDLEYLLRKAVNRLDYQREVKRVAEKAVNGTLETANYHKVEIARQHRILENYRAEAEKHRRAAEIAEINTAQEITRHEARLAQLVGGEEVPDLPQPQPSPYDVAVALLAEEERRGKSEQSRSASPPKPDLGAAFARLEAAVLAEEGAK